MKLLTALSRLVLLCGIFFYPAHLARSINPFSAGLSDNENLYDAPIPGFVGPGGEGRVSVPGYENPDTMQNVVNPLFLSWADTVVNYSPSPGVDAFWQYSGEALGPVTGNNFAVVSLGDLNASQIANGVAPGSLTISFNEPIRNLAGADFAVFENAFVSAFDTGGTGIGGAWVELAYVEVSSDGVHFARFPSISLTPDPVGAYGSVDPRGIYNLAGKHVNAYGDSWGTPFDLSCLVDHPLVLDGLVDLNAITHIRLVDIPGSGDFTDSLGNPIYDAWITWGSGGADIEAIGAISQPLTYEAWAQGQPLDPLGTQDDDGLSNLEKYAFRHQPGQPPEEASYRILTDNDGNLFLSFRRDQRNVSLRYLVEMTDDLRNSSSWQVIAEFGPFGSSEISLPGEVLDVEIIWRSPQSSVGVLQDVRLRLPPISSGPRFYRISLEMIE